MTKAKGLTRAERAEMKRLHADQKDRPPPSAEDRARGEEAKAWFLSKPDPSPPKLHIHQTADGITQIGPSCDDLEGWSCRWAKALGTHSKPLIDAFIRHALAQTGHSPVAEPNQLSSEAREAVAFIASLEPKSEIEAALALQMWSVHCATMKMSGHLRNATMRDALSDYSRMMNQTARTFASQVEALSKMRTGGKQQVEVRYVYVDARTQTVVNEGGGGGVPFGNPEQPHAPGTARLPFAPGLPVWGEDAGGVAVPVAGHPGAEAMPDARGPQPRRSEGRGERKLRLRTLDGRDHSGAGDSAGAGEVLSGDAA